MLRALERLLGFHDADRGARLLIPAVVLAATVLAFLVIGTITAAPLYVSLPNGAVIALVMAGLAVACMTSGAEDGPPDDRRGDHDDTPVLGSPGGPWTVVAHLGPARSPGEVVEPAPVSRSAAAGHR